MPPKINANIILDAIISVLGIRKGWFIGWILTKKQVENML
ncbi:MAG: hypothetical protein ACJASB_001420 [Shewanella psychromarinicola]|jgi:hypothetical protein